MATKKRLKNKDVETTSNGQVHFSVEPGTKLHITVDVGETIADGKIPLTLHIEQVRGDGSEVQVVMTPAAEPAASSFPTLTRLAAGLERVTSRLSGHSLATWLFGFALGIYLVTRLIGLTQFPVYFFTDEAIQTQSIVELVNNGYKDPSGKYFPTYFRNGEYHNLSTSVYIQWLPYLLFGKSAVVTRATSVFLTLIAAIAVGIILRDIFKMKYWWTATLLLSITPAWFLHSRTAFETVEFVSFYAGTLCAYLLYRYKSPSYLYLTVFLAALAFYTYSPAQLIVPITAIGLVLSDWRYHWANRRTGLIALVLLVILALPYLRFRLSNPDAPFAHLHILFSYWTESLPLSEKIRRYLTEYGIGLSPWYWYVPNDRDLPRHLMKGYGNIALLTLPFALLGMVHVLRNLREPACRAILIALLASPVSAALVQVSITRVLVFVVPAALLTAIGLEQVLLWLQDPAQRLAPLREGNGPSPRRLLGALLILFYGIPIALISTVALNRFVLSLLVIALALQVSGLLPRLARLLWRDDPADTPKLWRFPQTLLTLIVFGILSMANLSMMNDALRNGPLWYRDYGMGGLQYGAFQIFDLLKKYLAEHPNTHIIFSPDWANGTDVVTRFFLGNTPSVEMGSVRGHITNKLPLDENTLFVITPQEYSLVIEDPKFTNIRVEQILPYPDGQPGFYFVRMRYVDNVDEVFAAEREARQALQDATLNIDGEDVQVRFPYLDSDSQVESMALVFDGDPYTVAKTFETNPFVIELTFPTQRTINGFSIVIGSAKVQITWMGYPYPDAEPIVHIFEGQGSIQQPELSFDLPEPMDVQKLRVEVLDPLSPEVTKVHIWELQLR